VPATVAPAASVMVTVAPGLALASPISVAVDTSVAPFAGAAIVVATSLVTGVSDLSPGFFQAGFEPHAVIAPRPPTRAATAITVRAERALKPMTASFVDEILPGRGSRVIPPSCHVPAAPFTPGNPHRLQAIYSAGATWNRPSHRRDRR
jgi:hypothetical protein